MRALRSAAKRTLFILLWLGVAALLVGAAVEYALERHLRAQAERVPFVATTQVRRGDFIIYTDQVGAVEAEESTVVKAEAEGQVISRLPNGTVVKQGDVIASLDAPRMQQSVDEAERNVRRARDRISTSQHDRDAEIRQAELALQRATMDQEQAQTAGDAAAKDREAQLQFDQAALADAEANLERGRRLAATGLIPGDEIRRDELNLEGQRFALDKENQSLELESAKAQSDALARAAQVRMAKSNLERAKTRRDDELQNAKVELDGQERQLQRAREELAKAFIRAPASGMVAWVEQYRGPDQTGMLQEGDRVRTNQTVGQILDLFKMQVLLQLPQRVGEWLARTVLPGGGDSSGCVCEPGRRAFWPAER
jgi:HlyD family secretion protein